MYFSFYASILLCLSIKIKGRHKVCPYIKKIPRLSRVVNKNFIGPVFIQVGACLNTPGFLTLKASIHAIFRDGLPYPNL